MASSSRKRKGDQIHVSNSGEALTEATENKKKKPNFIPWNLVILVSEINEEKFVIEIVDCFGRWSFTKEKFLEVKCIRKPICAENKYECPIQVTNEFVTMDVLCYLLNVMSGVTNSINNVSLNAGIHTAYLLNVESLIKEFEKLLISDICFENASLYYETAVALKQNTLETKCVEFLLFNLTNFNTTALANISPEVFQILIKSPDLMLLDKFEHCLYQLTKQWILCREVTTNVSQISEHMDNFPSLYKTVFSKSTDGETYDVIFRSLKLIYFFHFPTEIIQIYSDNIINKGFLNAESLRRHLLIGQPSYSSNEFGFKNISNKEFFEKAHRCGHSFKSKSDVGWHISDYGFGIDLFISIKEKNDKTINLYIKRLHHNAGPKIVRSFVYQKTIKYCFTVLSSLEKKPLHSTGIKKTDFLINGEEPLFTLPRDVEFPVTLRGNVLCFLPLLENSDQCLKLTADEK